MWPDTESEKDYLNFGEISELVADILATDGMLPVSVGVFGNWGAGKSSLLKLIDQHLTDSEKDWIIVKFDAWLYQGYDDARAALLEIIATALSKSADKNSPSDKKIKKLLSHIDRFRALSFIVEGAATLGGVPTGGVLGRGIDVIGDTVNKSQEQSKDKKANNRMSPPQQINAFRQEYSEILESIDRPLVVIIDNLDRCLPTNAIHTLEAIRLFLFLKNTAFVIAADEEMIRSSVGDYFKGASDRHRIDYLDKLIQVPIQIPKSGQREVRSYLFMLYAIAHKLPEDRINNLRNGLETAMQQSWKDAPISRQKALKLAGESENAELADAFDRAERIAPILANSPIIQGNPRIVKRLLNVVQMRTRIARRRKMPLDEAIITKLVIFERCMGAQATAEFYQLVNSEHGKPVLLKTLENEKHETKNTLLKTWIDNPTTKDFLYEWAKLEPKLSGIDLRPAVYLSRETVPVGTYVIGLSPAGRKILELLLKTRIISSQTAKNSLAELSSKDCILVMEEIIKHLRSVSDWAQKPDGFAGAFILAKHSADAAKILKDYLRKVEIENPTPWLKAMLKAEKWYKES